MSTVEFVKWLDFFLGLALRLNIDVRRLVQMRVDSGGHLTDEQVEQLAKEADDTIANM